MNNDKRENAINNPEKMIEEIAKLKEEITNLEEQRRKSGEIRLQAKKDGNVDLEAQEITNRAELDAKINELKNIIN